MHKDRNLPSDRVAIRFFEHPQAAQIPERDPDLAPSLPTDADGNEQTLSYPFAPVPADFMLLHAQSIAHGLLQFCPPGTEVALLQDAVHRFFTLQPQTKLISIDRWMKELMREDDLPVAGPVTTAMVVKAACAVWQWHPISQHLAIETPLFDSILYTQDYEPDMLYFVYAFLGRMLYDVRARHRRPSEASPPRAAAGERAGRLAGHPLLSGQGGHREVQPHPAGPLDVPPAVSRPSRHAQRRHPPSVRLQPRGQHQRQRRAHLRAVGAHGQVDLGAAATPRPRQHRPPAAGLSGGQEELCAGPGRHPRLPLPPLSEAPAAAGRVPVPRERRGGAHGHTRCPRPAR